MASEETSLTLYQAESDLAAFLDTEEGGVPESVALEFQAALKSTEDRAIQKRDAVAWFRANLLATAEVAQAEANRLTERAARFKGAVARLDGYIKATILSLPRDRDGRPAKLEGRTSTMQLRTCPESVKLLNEEAVPSSYKNVSVRMPAPVWESLVGLAMRQDSVAVTSMLEKVTRGDLNVDKVAIKKAIKSGIDVAGADLATSNYTVECK